MSRKLRIATIASEVAPFSKSGGLADVTRSLSKAMKRLGHDIIVISPLYSKVIDKTKLKLLYKNIKINLDSKNSINVNFWKGYLMDDLPIYFIENTYYFSKHKKLYGSKNENLRFLIFDLASLELLNILKFKADIIHCHDWQTGLIPYFIKNNKRYVNIFKAAKTVFTIHNLVFQLGHDWWRVPNDKKDYGYSKLPLSSSEDIEYINFSKRAIVFSDVVNTVSEKYRQEIMTPKFGQDLNRILKKRQEKLFGIINGIDYYDYNPEKDDNLFKNYNYKNIEIKKENKEYLQKTLGLNIDEDVPVVVSTSRIVFQKGFQLFLEILENLLKLDLQMVIMGDGQKEYISKLKKIQSKHKKKIVWLPFEKNKKLETLIYAGSDMFLLPSHHEPCGINQLIAMRYGCIPIVRSVGGLEDTVSNYNPKTKRGNGFSFGSYNPFALYGAIIRALENYNHKKSWQSLVVKAMKESNSWEIPAKKYLGLYRKALKN